jgi:hypothetical protein
MPFPPPRGFFIVRQTWSLGAGWTFQTSPKENHQPVVFAFLLLRTGITSEVSTSQCAGDSIFVANRTTGRVHKPSTLLEVLQELVVDETTGAFVKGAVDSHNITLDQRLFCELP